MPLYATQADMVTRFGEDELIQLTDRAEPYTGAVVASILDAALGDADELIDSYIGKRYGLPLASVPPRLTKVACDLARFYLHDEAATEQVKANRDQAIQFLRDVAAGRAELHIAGTEPAREGDTVSVSAPTRRFTRDSMEGF